MNPLFQSNSVSGSVHSPEIIRYNENLRYHFSYNPPASSQQAMDYLASARRDQEDKVDLFRTEQKRHKRTKIAFAIVVVLLILIFAVIYARKQNP